jgi:hypothetical protein
VYWLNFGAPFMDTPTLVCADAGTLGEQRALFS